MSLTLYFDPKIKEQLHKISSFCWQLCRWRLCPLCVIYFHEEDNPSLPVRRVFAWIPPGVEMARGWMFDCFDIDYTKPNHFTGGDALWCAFRNKCTPEFLATHSFVFIAHTPYYSLYQKQEPLLLRLRLDSGRAANYMVASSLYCTDNVIVRTDRMNIYSTGLVTRWILEGTFYRFNPEDVDPLFYFTTGDYRCEKNQVKKGHEDLQQLIASSSFPQDRPFDREKDFALCRSIKQPWAASSSNPNVIVPHPTTPDSS